MPDPIVELLQTSPGIPYYMIPLLTMPLLALYYSETSLSLILLFQSNICGGILYHNFSQVSEHDNVSIQSDHVLFS